MILPDIAIAGGDYRSAGEASKRIKAALKQIGVDGSVLRRAMVAVYEAEMNVVIHAYDGILRAALTPEALDVFIEDTGPGIPDIGQAMREGYSTAPPEAREMGFGAGMGLPNIRRNSDRFSIQSETPGGTRMRFTVLLQPEASSSMRASALCIEADRCNQCLRCLGACPTQAIRLCDGRPEIMRHLCVDCTACMEVCPRGVFGLDAPEALPEASEEAVLALPAALLGQFGANVPRAAVESALTSIGWRKVVFSHPWETAIATAAQRHAGPAGPGVLMAPVCPAVLNLIQLRYPSLLPRVAPFLTAIEAMCETLGGGTLVVVAPCAAQLSLARLPQGLRRIEIVRPEGLIRALRPLVKAQDAPEARELPVGAPPVLRITGMFRVSRFLDAAENGLLNDCGVVELYACDEGCFGAPVWHEQPAVARVRADVGGLPEAPALERLKPLEARAGIRLDDDMGQAIAKLMRIDRLAARLPGRNCGVCGAPTCMALAEDTVMGRAREEDCIFRTVPGSTVSDRKGEENAR